MTAMDGLIEVHGVSVDIYRESEGAEDDYMDPTSTWNKQATETALIQHGEGLRGWLQRETAAGVLEASDYIGFFKSDSVVADGDYVTDGSSKWDVKDVRDIKLLGQVAHKEAHLKLIEEG